MRPLRVLLAVVTVLLAIPAGALAHGDPTTHYLESSDFYPGFSVKRASQASELKLMGLLEAAKKAGYPMKVSLLGDESDVADRPQMLKHPQKYANFVATELKRSSVKLVGPVIVISPSGIGIAGPGAEKLEITPGDDGEHFVSAASTAIRQLARDAGHPLPATVPPATVPAVEPRKTAGPGYDLSGLTPFAVFIAIFGSAVLYLQIRTRLARRRVQPTQL
jgi:hypothetical protein